MGIPLTIQPEDDERIIFLKEQTRSKSKIDVIRRALTLLELEVAKKERIKKWQKAAKLVRENGSSSEVLEDFMTNKGRFRKL